MSGSNGSLMRIWDDWKPMPSLDFIAGFVFFMNFSSSSVPWYSLARDFKRTFSSEFHGILYLWCKWESR